MLISFRKLMGSHLLRRSALIILGVALVVGGLWWVTLDFNNPWEQGFVLQIRPPQGSEPSLGISCLRFSEDGRYLAVGTTGGFVTILTTSNGQIFEERQLYREEVPLWSFRFSRDATLLSTVSATGRLDWNFLEDRIARELDWSEGRTWATISEVSHDLSKIAWVTLGESRVDVITNEDRWSIEDLSDRAVALEFSRDGRFLALRCMDEESISVWDLETRRRIYQLPDQKRIRFLQFCRNDSEIILGSDESLVRWDLKQGTTTHLAEVEDLFSMAASTRGNLIAHSSGR